MNAVAACLVHVALLAFVRQSITARPELENAGTESKTPASHDSVREVEIHGARSMSEEQPALESSLLEHKAAARALDGQVARSEAAQDVHGSPSESLGGGKLVFASSLSETAAAWHGKYHQLDLSGAEEEPPLSAVRVDASEAVGHDDATDAGIVSHQQEERKATAGSDEITKSTDHGDDTPGALPADGTSAPDAVLSTKHGHQTTGEKSFAKPASTLGSPSEDMEKASHEHRSTPQAATAIGAEQSPSPTPSEARPERLSTPESATAIGTEITRPVPPPRAERAELVIQQGPRLARFHQLDLSVDEPGRRSSKTAPSRARAPDGSDHAFANHAATHAGVEQTTKIAKAPEHRSYRHFKDIVFVLILFCTALLLLVASTSCCCCCCFGSLPYSCAAAVCERQPGHGKQPKAA